ncbi:hypothetical protein [Microbulbifer yueqingensis]|uniref:SmpA / OmlA family protein n=1 Tax=Microbulbifer yueqingensis TaxID=658219 RepID=A0A1G9A6R4_9GAMM|nr:hypothetical protein [Microbulbifer yueqingensis]SDK22285.1 hypothetical protein SAMN05216212_1857 [Microbulbifer yueqingensis]
MYRNTTNLTRLRAVAGALVLGFSASAAAETVEVPVGSQGMVAEASSLRGLDKDQVTARLGEPVGIQGPVGDPAISRWEYADYYVYFEWDKVLHVVSKPRG